jgi:guanyl-specific ribonuclease Sa
MRHRHRRPLLPGGEAHRLPNDGLIYYTEDHYASFELL